MEQHEQLFKALENQTQDIVITNGKLKISEEEENADENGSLTDRNGRDWNLGLL